MTLITELKGDVTPIFATQMDDDESETCSLPPLSARSDHSVIGGSSTTSSRKTKKPSSSSQGTPRSTTQRGFGGSKSRSTAQSKQSGTFSRKEDKNKANNKNFIAR